MVLSVWLNPWLGLALILPGLVPHFFTGGAAGVYGNAVGGRLGAMASGFTNGLLITFLPALLLEVLGDFGDANTTFGDTDFGWVGLAMGYPAKLGVPGLAIIVIITGAFLAAAILFQKRLVETGWDPAPHYHPEGSADFEGSGSGSGSGSKPEPVAAGSVSNYPRIAPPQGAPAPPPPPD